MAVVGSGPVDSHLAIWAVSHPVCGATWSEMVLMVAPRCMLDASAVRGGGLPRRDSAGQGLDGADVDAASDALEAVYVRDRGAGAVDDGGGCVALW